MVVFSKVVYDPAPAPDVVLYGAYFAVVGTIGLGLAYGSSTLNDFVSSGFSFNSLKESIDNFHWNRGVYNQP
eukprot:662235-Amorphochlora_amoeboformis.AAC.2